MSALPLDSLALNRVLEDLRGRVSGTIGQNCHRRASELWHRYSVLIADRRGSTNRLAACTSCVSTASGSLFRTGSRSPAVGRRKADRLDRSLKLVQKRQVDGPRLCLPFRIALGIPGAGQTCRTTSSSAHRRAKILASLNNIA